MDHLSPEKRSWNMSRIRSDKTKPEQLVASYLREHHMGYRRAVKDLPGKPVFFIRTLMEYYDIEEEDFVYSARSTKRVENSESAEDSL